MCMISNFGSNICSIYIIYAIGVYYELYCPYIEIVNINKIVVQIGYASFHYYRAETSAGEFEFKLSTAQGRT